MKIVFNSSPLIFLSRLDFLDLFLTMEAEFLLPESVKEEISAKQDQSSIHTEVLNVKILRILSKLCIGIGDTKFEQLMTLFSIDNGFYLGKTKRL
ncbi:hypothetical protein [Sphaerospermopsis sp. LEGE 00249]|uniref:hypothetical protein n=1 Tax=Sphaerospermopsis sp. LEGE 00249 TaxID=1380707 RepID=UPI001C9AACBA|nr:hypothetical protein [Sphaerospermopsis sp. LEGE 00249]